MRELILASNSPRRKELLSLAGFTYTCYASDVDETFDERINVGEAAQQIALKKAQAAQPKYPDALIISADTIVVLDDTKLGKPQNRADAKKMLMQLSGKTHRVISAVAILDKEEAETFYVESRVTFYPLSDEMIETYLDSNEYSDKAGAYGIQGKACIFVEKIDGDYYNIVGLPIAKVYQKLKLKQ